MSDLRTREYLISRIEQCKQSATDAKDPGIRALHLQFAKLYEKEAQRLWVETASRVAAAGLSARQRHCDEWA